MTNGANIQTPKVLVDEVLNLMFKVIAIISPMSPSLHMVFTLSVDHTMSVMDLSEP